MEDKDTNHQLPWLASSSWLIVVWYAIGAEVIFLQEQSSSSTWYIYLLMLHE